MSVHVPEVQLCIKIKFQKQLIPMEKYIWDYTVMCAKAGWEHCGYWMHCECCGINAAWIGLESLWLRLSGREPHGYAGCLSVCLFCPVSVVELGGEHSNAPLLSVVNIPMGKAIPGSSSHHRLMDTDKEEELENFLSLLCGYFFALFL